MSIKNFGEVIPGKLYRSGKYDLSGLREAVTQFSIRQIIDLRDRHDTHPFLARGTYKKLGCVFYNYPLNERKPIGDIAQLTVLIDIACTLVHCWNGAHRTGAVIAKYRFAMGWKWTEIWEEMQRYNFGDPQKYEAIYKDVYACCIVPSWPKPEPLI